MAVLEAGGASYMMADPIRELGGEVKMANPLRVNAIACARIKTDKRNSRTLAQLLRTDLISEVHQPGDEKLLGKPANALSWYLYLNPYNAARS